MLLLRRRVGESIVAEMASDYRDRGPRRHCAHLHRAPPEMPVHRAELRRAWTGK